MRRVFVPVLLLLGLSGCVTPRADGSPQIQTTQEANRENLQGAAKAPLRDLNLMRTEIPEVLLQAMADPYQKPPGRLSCAQLTQLITPLDQALGADLDEPSVDEDDVMDKGRGATLGAVAGVAEGAIPFRGWVRQLTGAQKHDRIVQAAILAGGVRRGYLKGLGESRGCGPPATPSHALTGSPVISQKPEPVFGRKPRYGIR
jgi:hypothetical protein